MPLTPEQRQRVLDAITSGRLRFDAPTKMYAGFGAGRICDGCGEPIDKTQVEHEAVYESAPGTMWPVRYFTCTSDARPCGTLNGVERLGEGSDSPSRVGV